MKKAEDFRKAFGPADAGFRTVMQKTIEGLKAEEEKKKASRDLRQFRMPALAAAMAVVLIVGIAARGGFHGLISRPDEIAPNGIQYTAQPIETTLAQGTEEIVVSQENETEYALIQRALGFVEHWNAAESRTDEDLDEMLKLCVPEWKEEVGDARTALNGILGDSACAGFDVGNSVSGNAGDPIRTLTCNNVLLALGDKGYQKYRMEFDLCLGKDGLRYIDPESIRKTMPKAETGISSAELDNYNINARLDNMWPGIRQELVPVNLSCEKHGLQFEVVSALVERHVAYFVCSLQNAEGDLFNSATIGQGRSVKDSFELCRQTQEFPLDYDETDRRYTFGIKRTYDKELPYGDGNFSLSMEDLPLRQYITADLTPYLQTYGKTEQGIKLPELLRNDSWIYQDGWQETGKVLGDAHPLEIELAENIFLTGIGWVNGELHVRIHFTDNRELVSERMYSALRYESELYDYEIQRGIKKGTLGHRIAELAWDDTGDGVPDWMEYVLEGGPEDKDHIELKVGLIIVTGYVEDEWNVEVPLRLVRQDPDQSDEIEYENDGLKYMLHYDGTATVVSIADDRKMDWVDIPELVNKHYRVTEIGDGAFENCKTLENIHFSIYVEHIGDRAFRGCTGLTGAYFPAKMSSIGVSAFEGCTGLMNAVFAEEENFSIGENAFRGCTSLTEVTLPSGTSGVGSSLFADCVNLESVTLPLMVTGVSDSMFSGCVRLETVSMPEGQRYIGKNAFEGCLSLDTIDLTDQMMFIDDEAFKGCKALDNLVIPASTWGIGERAFQDCTGMKTITVQTKKLEEIGEDVWKGCDEQKISVILDGETKTLADWYEEARKNIEQP